MTLIAAFYAILICEPDSRFAHIYINRKTKRTKTVHNFVRVFTNKLADNKQFIRNQAISNICLIISDLTF